MISSSERALQLTVTRSASNASVKVLAWTLFLVPALGVPGPWMVQDTLKSAVLSIGTIVAALAFFWQERQRQTPLLWHGILCLPLALVVYALGSMAWSHIYLSGVEAVRWFLLALLLWLMLNTLNKHNLFALLKAVHWGAFVASCWAGLQFWGDLNVFPQGPQPASTFYNRNFFAEYAVCALPYSFWLLASTRQSPWLPAVAITVALNVTAILMTGTRSALIALLALAPLLLFALFRYRRTLSFFYWRRSQKSLVVFVLVAGIGSLGSLATGNEQIIKEGLGTTALQRSFVRTASVATSNEYAAGTFSVRTQMWMATARMLMAHPLAGVGAGAWEVQVPLYQRSDTVLETDFYAHNELLQLLAEYGLPLGGLVCSILLAYWIHAVARTAQLGDTDLPLATSRALPLVGLVPLLIVSSAGFPLHLAGCGALFVLGLGILAVSDGQPMPQERLLISQLRWKPVYSSCALLFLVGCFAAALGITQQAVHAESAMVRAAHLADQWVQANKLDPAAQANLKAELLHNLHEALAINPHERKFSVNTADLLAVGGDLQNATRILEMVAKSRPHVTNVWYSLAMNYASLGQYALAEQALQQVQRLKPKAWATLTLEVTLLNAADPVRAVQRLKELFNQGIFDIGLLELGYSVGLKTQEWDLSIRALQLMQAKWPERAADTYFKLGSLYADPAVHETAKALEAFQAGLAAMPSARQEEYEAHIPLPYRQKVQKKPL